MDEDFLDDDLRRFIAEHIASVEQLEILLLLSDEPDRSWTVDDVFKLVQSNPSSITTRLKQLQEAGFVVLDDRGQYCYRSCEALSDRVARLRLAYRQSRVRVLETIFSESLDQAKSFAASFRIKKS